jgi:hypothetical protein
VTEPELRVKLIELVDSAISRMLELDRVDAGLLSLVAGAAATIAALDARKQSKRTA